MAELSVDNLKNDLNHRMSGALEVLHDQFSGLRTGRAVTSLLSPITVQAYGSEMTMDQVGTINVPEPRLLSVQVWDKELVNPVVKAIMESGLGLNPSAEGQVVRVPLPALTEERRLELTKVTSKYAEDSRVAVRNVRRHAMDSLKSDEKKGNISEDQLREYSAIVQTITDQFVKKIDDSLNHKNQEIMQV